MFFIIGFLIVFGSVLGGYLPHGSAAVLFQPFEFLIILGAGIGAFVISNPKPVLAATGKRIGRIMKGTPYNKAAYLELLTLMYSMFKLIRSKGLLAIEAHIENPEESALFYELSDLPQEPPRGDVPLRLHAAPHHGHRKSRM